MFTYFVKLRWSLVAAFTALLLFILPLMASVEATSHSIPGIGTHVAVHQEAYRVAIGLVDHQHNEAAQTMSSASKEQKSRVQGSILRNF